jgi:hypothetical protein
VRWLRGEYTTKTEARADLKVRSIIDDESYYDYLKLLAAFVRIAGYKGLLVCIDELVVLSHRLNNRQSRDRNYEAVLRILNDCLQGSVEGLGFIFAATDECLTETSGGDCSAMKPWLQGWRQNRFAGGALVDLSGPVITLSSLTPRTALSCSTTSAASSPWTRMRDKVMPEAGLRPIWKAARSAWGRPTSSRRVKTVKDFVGLLSVLQQNPGADWRQLIAGIKTAAPSSEPPAVDEDDAPEGNARPGPATSPVTAVAPTPTSDADAAQRGNSPRRSPRPRQCLR